MNCSVPLQSKAVDVVHCGSGIELADYGHAHCFVYIVVHLSMLHTCMSNPVT
jgi:hypothetical protein